MSPQFRMVQFSVANYRPISITSVLSKVYERLVSVRFERFMERNCVLPPTQFAYRKVWVPVMQFCACPIHCKVHWRVARIVQIDFSAAFDRVNHQGILYRLCSVGIGDSVLSILTVSVKPITARYGGWFSE